MKKEAILRFAKKGIKTPNVVPILVGLVAVAYFVGVIVGHTAGVHDEVAIAKKQEQESQVAEAARQKALAQQQEASALKSEKLDEFLGGAEIQGKNLAVIPFVTGEVQLKSRSFWESILSSRYAIISPDDLSELLSRFERKMKVKVTSHILEPERVIVSFEPFS